ncbi:MAG TPA: hypothetical protein ENK52_00710 [Saprospiraceae bacterium]|nr:hypothetical protein [Saprospiraceae bacterium]
MSKLIDQVVIKKHFCGPPNSGNGGYVCGVLARYLEGTVEITLRIPPPLDKVLDIIQTEEGFRMMDGEQLVASAKTATLELEIPAAPNFEQAVAASKNYKGFQHHHFNTCFVCGPTRRAGEGLQLYAGNFGEKNKVATPWIPYDELFDENDLLKEVYYAAALDCPGYFSLIEEELLVLVLGRMTRTIKSKIKKGERLVVMGWKLASEGRKHFCGTAIIGENGELKAYAKSTWIEIKLENVK